MSKLTLALALGAGLLVPSLDAAAQGRGRSPSKAGAQRAPAQPRSPLRPPAANGGSRALPRGAAPGAPAGQSTVPRRAWSYANHEIATDPELQQIHRAQTDMLVQYKDTPELVFVPRGLPPGVRVTKVRSASGDHVHAIYEVSGLSAGGVVPGIAMMPTSGHYGLDPKQLAQDQRHTLWMVHGTESYTARTAENTVVDGVQSFGPAGQRELVTAVRTEIPLRPGSNRLHFDPYPGKSAGVGGYPGGRTIEFIVK